MDKSPAGKWRLLSGYRTKCIKKEGRGRLKKNIE